MVILTILALIMISALQIPGMIKRKLIGEAVVYVALMIIAAVYSISGLTDWVFPAPESLVVEALDPVSRFVFPNRLR